MSIVDVDDNIDNIDVKVPLECKERRLKEIRGKYEFENEASLDSDVFEQYCANLSKVDAFYVPSIPGIPNFGTIRENVVVIFSDQEKTYADKYDDSGLEKVDVLGEYCNSQHAHVKSKIYIYVNSIIKNTQGNGSEIDQLMLAVYIHELYHAYFKSNTYIRELEEPLCEFGALFCLEVMTAMRIVNDHYLNYYKEKVAGKKELLPEYGMGGYIYDMLSDMNIGNLKLLDLYKTKINGNQVIFKPGSIDKLDQNNYYKQICNSLGYVD